MGTMSQVIFQKKFLILGESFNLKMVFELALNIDLFMLVFGGMFSWSWVIRVLYICLLLMLLVLSSSVILYILAISLKKIVLFICKYVSIWFVWLFKWFSHTFAIVSVDLISCIVLRNFMCSDCALSGKL